MTMNVEDLKEYFRIQQSSLQWGPVLAAMGAELSAQSDAETLRQLFARVGRRMADDVMDSEKDIRTLRELVELLNDLWMRVNWGWLDIKEDGGRLEVSHFCAPLTDAFGVESLGWSVGLLEGFYERVFKRLGADESAALRAQQPIGDGAVLRFQLTY
ncbi:MAG: hypothetical protein LCH89_05300 [Proteobacteria bacterium]|jgi:hypothetical protein|nr:hypothetical protein [Pseudomonadota bacterium]